MASGILGDSVFGYKLPLGVVPVKYKDNGTPTAASTLTIDYALGNWHKVTVANNFTMAAFTNLPPTGTPWSIVMELVNGTAAVITWAAAFVTAGDAVLEQTASGTDILVFSGNTNTTKIFGFLSGADMT